jgi:hypothetical protein
MLISFPILSTQSRQVHLTRQAIAFARMCGVTNMVTKFSLHPDPSRWGYDVSPKSLDDDDWLHEPDQNIDAAGTIWNARGISSIGCLAILAVGLTGLLCVYHSSSPHGLIVHQYRFLG